MHSRQVRTLKLTYQRSLVSISTSGITVVFEILTIKIPVESDLRVGNPQNSYLTTKLTFLAVITI